MSFLDKAKTQANNIINSNKGGAPMGNPFIKTPSAPAAAPVVAPGVKPTVPGTKPTVPGVKPTIPGKPSIPGVKPVVPGAKPTMPTPPVPNKPVAPVAPIKEEKVEPATPVVEAKVEVPTPVVEPVVETKVETPEVKAETTQEPVAEEKKAPAKKKTTSRKKATAKTEEVKDAPENTSVEVAELVIPKTDVSYADACQSIRSNFVDEEWDAQVAYFEEKSRNILISNDMNKAQLHDLLAQVTNLRDEMYTAFVSTKTLYEHLTEKDNGLIDVTKRLHGKGSNPEERKYHATVAVMNYKSEAGDNINLYELLAETRLRYNFLKGLNDTIEFKKAVLLTMLSSLKSN